MVVYTVTVGKNIDHSEVAAVEYVLGVTDSEEKAVLMADVFQFDADSDYVIVEKWDTEKPTQSFELYRRVWSDTAIVEDSGHVELGESGA